jgi:phosphoribosyl 1,2-cyclic phosphodiesterase
MDDGETQLLADCFFTRPAIILILTSKIPTDTTVVNRVLFQNKMDRLKALFVTHSHYEHSLDA